MNPLPNRKASRSVDMRAVVLVLVFATMAHGAPGDLGTPEHARATELVKRLGDIRFATREAAAQALVEMGEAAVVSLREGAQSTDEEARARCVVLLPKAMARDWERKADAFLADVDGKREHKLPLLAEYRSYFGRDAASGRLFAEMVRNEGRSLQEAVHAPAAARVYLARRSRQLRDSFVSTGTQTEIPTGEAAAILFLHILHQDWPAATARDEPAPHSVLANAGVAEGLSDKVIGPGLRKLIARWIQSRPADDENAVRNFALLAHLRPNPEWVPQLVRIVKNSRDAPVKKIALESLGRAGDGPGHEALTALLSDSTVLFSFIGGEDSPLQVRDAALAALVNARNGDPTSYHLACHSRARYLFGGHVVEVGTYAFPSANARSQGIEKWKMESTKRD